MDKYLIKINPSNKSDCENNEKLNSKICQFQFKLFKEENITFEEFLEFTNVKELVEISLRRKHPKNIEARLKKVNKYAKKVYKSCQTDPRYLSKTTTFLNLQCKPKPWLHQDNVGEKISETYKEINAENDEITEVEEYSNFAPMEEKEVRKKRPGPKSMTTKKAKTILEPIIQNSVEMEEETEINVASDNINEKVIALRKLLKIGSYGEKEQISESKNVVSIPEDDLISDKSTKRPETDSKTTEKRESITELLINNELQKEDITEKSQSLEINVNYEPKENLIKFRNFSSTPEKCSIAGENKNKLLNDKIATNQTFNTLEDPCQQEIRSQSKNLENMSNKMVQINICEISNQQTENLQTKTMASSTEVDILNKTYTETCKDKSSCDANYESSIKSLEEAENSSLFKKYEKYFERCSVFNLTEELKKNVIIRYEKELKRRNLKRHSFYNSGPKIKESVKDKIFKMSFQEFKIKTNIVELIYNTRKSRIGKKMALINLDKYVETIYNTFIKKSIWIENLKLDYQFWNNLKTSDKLMDVGSVGKTHFQKINNETNENCTKQNSNNITGFVKKMENCEKLTQNVSNSQIEKLDDSKNIQISDSNSINKANSSVLLPLQISNENCISSRRTPAAIENKNENPMNTFNLESHLCSPELEIKNQTVTQSQNAVHLNEENANENSLKMLHESDNRDKNSSPDFTKISVKKEHDTQYSNYLDDISVLSQEMNKIIIVEDDEMEDVNKILKEMMSSSQPQHKKANYESVQTPKIVSTEFPTGRNHNNKLNSLPLKNNLASEVGVEIENSPKAYLKSNTLGEETTEIDFSDFGCKSAPPFTSEDFHLNMCSKSDLLKKSKCFQNNLKALNSPLMPETFSKKRLTDRRQLIKKIMQNALSSTDDDLFTTPADGRVSGSNGFNSNLLRTKGKCPLAKNTLKKPEFRYESNMEGISEKCLELAPSMAISEKNNTKKYSNLDLEKICNYEPKDDKNEEILSFPIEEVLSTLLNTSDENTEPLKLSKNLPQENKHLNPLKNTKS